MGALTTIGNDRIGTTLHTVDCAAAATAAATRAATSLPATPSRYIYLHDGTGELQLLYLLNNY